jgi:hypothetical protein
VAPIAAGRQHLAFWLSAVTDHGSLPTFVEFPRCIAESKKTWQVNQIDFPISTDIAGANMRLTTKVSVNCIVRAQRVSVRTG